MKLVIAIIQDKDAGRLLEALVEKDFRATKLATTGGFLKAGNTTLLIGVEKERVDQVVGIIKNICKSREQIATPIAPMGAPIDSYIPYPIEVQVGGATIFVVDVERFEKV